MTKLRLVSSAKLKLVEGSPDQPRDDHGRWTSEGGNAKAIADATFRSGAGGSFSTHGQKRPTTGYMVAEKDHERIVDAHTRDAVRDAVAKYRADYKAPLTRDQVFLGTWLEHGKLYLDNSHNIQDRKAAFAFSDAHNQFAVYNLGIMKAENTRQDGKRPSESSAPLTEAEQPPQAHKLFFSDDMSDDEIADAIWATRDKGGDK